MGILGDIVGGIGDGLKAVGKVAGGIVEGVLDVGGNVVGGVFKAVGLDAVGNAIDGGLDGVGSFLNDAIQFSSEFAAFGLDPMNNLKDMLGAAGGGRPPAGAPGEVLTYDRDLTEEVLAGMAQLERGLHETILEPLRAMQGRLGDIWVGSDADQLSEAMAQQMPRLEAILDDLGALQSGVRNFTQSIDDADESVEAKLRDLADQYAMIA